MKRSVKIGIGIAVVVVLAGAGGAWLRSREPKGTPVRTAEVARRDLVSLVTANGTLQAKTKVDLSANIMGQIVTLAVEEGQAVRKGDLLLVIDPARFSAVVDARRAGLEALEARLVWAREAAAQARRDLGRAERQFRDEILPAAEYDRAKSQFEQASAEADAAERQVSQARADLAGARDELAKTEIRAPMDGIVTRRNVEQGEVVVTGTMNNPGTVLMTISDMSEIEAVLEVDQTDLPLLERGQPASVLIDAFPDETFPGTVTEIGSSPIQGQSLLGGAATGTDYEVKVTLGRFPNGVRPGLTVTADITTDTREEVLAIPVGAIVVRDAEEVEGAAVSEPEQTRESTEIDRTATVASRSRDVEGVYVVVAGKAEFREIEAGIKGEMDVEVVSGLESGERIVVGPFQALREIQPGDDVVDEGEPGEADEGA